MTNSLFTLSNIQVEKVEDAFDGIGIYTGINYNVKFDFTFNGNTTELCQCIFKGQSCIESLEGTKYRESAKNIDVLDAFEECLENAEYDFYANHHSIDGVICEELQKHIDKLNLEF